MVLNNPLFVARNSRSSSYQIEQSLQFDGDSYLQRDPSSAGSRRTWTFSFWLKRAALSGDQTILMTPKNSGYSRIDINSASGSSVNFLQYNGSSYDFRVALTVNRLRDPSAWYHIVVAVDTTQSTASNRVKFYVNGSLETELNPSSNTYPSQNFDIELNGTGRHYLGLSSNYGLAYLNGYLAEVNYIDGSQLAATDFGEYDDNGVWRPIEYSGSYTGNSYYLKFDAADVDGDSSGLGNDWTASAGFTTSGTETDVMSDTPTNNFATLNPLEPASASAGTLSQGNLYIANQDYSLQKATFRFGGGGPTSGKYYWEVTHTGGDYTSYIGVTANLTQDAGEIAGGGDKSWFGNNTSRKYDNTTQSYTGSYSSGDIHGYAIDLDAQEIKYYINGTLKITDSTLPDPATTELVPFQFTTNSGSGYSWSNTSWNFGQRAFSHQPTGYRSLCTSNLPQATIKDGSKYFNTVLYEGNASNGNSITGVGFQPDLTFIKDRDTNGHDYVMTDSTRGTSLVLRPNSTGGEYTQTDAITSFDSDGFTLGDDNSVGQAGNFNTSNSHVAWNWKKGTTPGFDIVNYTGNGYPASGTQNISHNAGGVPVFITIKNRDQTSQWFHYIGPLGAGGGFEGWNDGDKWATNANHWNNTAPTSSVFTVGTDSTGNYDGADHIAYVWAEVPGFSKAGLYDQNGSSDGPFIYLGFSPALVVIKEYNGGTEAWAIYDNKRLGYNPNDYPFLTNLPQTESYIASTYPNDIDFLSNGFKIRNTDSRYNSTLSTYKYFYMAWAEHPFGGSNVAPNTAK